MKQHNWIKVFNTVGRVFGICDACGIPDCGENPSKPCPPWQPAQPNDVKELRDILDLVTRSCKTQLPHGVDDGYRLATLAEFRLERLIAKIEGGK